MKIERSLTILALAFLSAIAFPLAWAKEGGSNVGGGNRGSQVAALACGNVRATLLSHQQTARLLLERDITLKAEAKLTLAHGFEVALRNEGLETNARSVLYRSLERGKELALALDEQALTYSDPQDAAESSLKVLNAYYDFILGVVIPLESEFLIAWIYPGSGPLDQEQFENRFIEYAREELRWANGALVSIRGDGKVIPLRSPKAYLKASELMTRFAAEDLTHPESPWASAYEGTAQVLRELSEKIRAHLVGNSFPWGDDMTASEAVFENIRFMVTGIRTARVWFPAPLCSRHAHGTPEHPVQCPNHPKYEGVIR